MQRHRVGGFAFSFLHLLNQTEEKINGEERKIGKHTIVTKPSNKWINQINS
jgi:hypothetical protein|tara:strand:- start:94 stop:246 length:153 start_codon:yes stop_codon:yes gene_type:complete